MHWEWNHNPIDNAWSLKERPGFLRLKTNRVVENLYLAPNTLTQRMEGPTCSGYIAMDISKTQRMEGPTCSGYIAMDISKMKDGDCAGLAAFNGDSGVLTIKKQGKKYVLEMSEQKVSLTDREKAVTNVEVKVIETVDLSAAFKKSKSQIIYLRLDGDFRPGHHDVANFYYSLDGENWTKIGTENYRMIFDYRRFFMGTKFGIFNYATKKAGGYVDVDEFCYSKTEK